MTLGLERVDVIEGEICCHREVAKADNDGVMGPPLNPPPRLDFQAW